MDMTMDKNIFQIKIKDNVSGPLNEDDFELWNERFRTWKKAQISRCHKIKQRENYGSDSDFIKDMEDLTKNKHFHEALIKIHQKLVANVIKEIEPYWTGLKKDKYSVIALLCTKYGLDIDQAKSLFECPDQELGHFWGLNIPMYSLSGVKIDDEQTSRTDKILWLLTKGEETLFDRLCRLPSPEDTEEPPTAPETPAEEPPAVAPASETETVANNVGEVTATGESTLIEKQQEKINV